MGFSVRACSGPSDLHALQPEDDRDRGCGDDRDLRDDGVNQGGRRDVVGQVEQAEGTVVPPVGQRGHRVRVGRQGDEVVRITWGRGEKAKLKIGRSTFFF